ncbi:cyclin-D-binding Myb-like transcription factor 1 [Entelurus aequoreus]|uniref:cyclin-D-binding Myb-like transcription factor 1 n=1 Tax=Entelurus aequoreus TaxID=161455 RepID=UPI002B1D9039|nr:cyclin-D-binding Myb-like transcription factor 1 [Entelurus aequoreus]
MSAAEEERDGDTLETVESVTLTHDDDDGVALHSPPNDDDCEPPAKKVCVAPEDSDSSFSVVAVPMADDHERFEVTMTTTAEGGLSQEGVAHIQVLREEALSANEKAEVSAVSQAWFTTKEDKDSLTNKGHKWKQGMWSKEEIDVLMSNIKQYVKVGSV